MGFFGKKKDNRESKTSDEQLKKERAAAGVVLEKSVATPMSDELLEQYKG